MKLLKNFGVVVGIHVLAFALLWAIPGCSSTSKPAAAAADPAPKGDPVAKADPAPVIAVPAAAPSDSAVISAAPPAPAADATAAGSGAFFSPTRPNTPAAEALETQPVTDVTPASTYTVKNGDSLWVIAKKNHLKVSELAAANNLRSGSTLHVGQKLIIPSKALTNPAPETARAQPAAATAAGTAPAAAKPATTEITYTIRANETLGSIARRFKVRVADLATKNNISDPAKIRPGQTLIIPAGGHVASKHGTKSGAGTGGSAAAAPASAPPADQDLDAGAPPAPSTEVPLIKISGAADTSSPAVTPAPAH